jgi:hypothetical protein
MSVGHMIFDQKDAEPNERRRAIIASNDEDGFLKTSYGQT